MVAGHFAAGLALFGWQRDRSLVSFVLLLVGAMLADLLWTVLTPFGLEGGYSLGSQEFHVPRLTYSHSVVTTVPPSISTRSRLRSWGTSSSSSSS